MSKLPTTCTAPFEGGGGLCKVCRLLPEVPQGRRCSRMVARSAPMQQLLLKASTVAHTDATVVIHGESGSGKEVLARAIHANSKRRLGPFVAINCAALPGELLESELFGHVRGAFTGATSARQGLFEASSDGTLFLDEVAELPLALQAKLLRAVQDGEVRRVGATEPIHVDVRLLCATHQDLKRAVEEKRFREDLYFRLKVFTLTMPSLRERPDDIPLLANLFLDQEQHTTRRFTEAALGLLLRYRWPGNVRELANAVKHGAVLSRGTDVAPEHLPDEVREATEAPRPSSAPDDELMTLEAAEKRHVLRVLEACGGQQSEAARVLGIGRSTLWRKLKEWHVEGLGPDEA